MSSNVEAFLNQLHHPALASIDLSLDRMHRLLGLLGSPHKRLPPVIHVAGTNGKGSLMANLYAIFDRAGYSVHRYTSPHLVRFSERIMLNGKEIDNAYLEKLLRHVAPILQQQPATFFEATTALAYLAFAEHKADVLLLETGMGGRLDATNVIDKPLLTAITPIAMDHMEYLGDSLEKIAPEKAGILKKGVPCVVGKQEAIALSIIEKTASELGAPLYCEGKDWSHDAGNYRSAKRSLTFKPALAGAYQYDNAAMAIACVDQLVDFSISDEHIVSGIAKAHWPARLQNITAQAGMPNDIELWLDGGHNPQGGQVLADWCAAQTKEITLICAMMKDKDSKAFLAPMAPHVKKLYAVAIDGEAGSKTAEQLKTAASEAGIAAEAMPSFQKALQTATHHATTGSIICICGSLYLAGKILATLEGTRHAG
ncbi:MAG: bifunctional folylpolyglutamate synthase/dihydrofolate synthase [Rickettsiales bacterium]